MCALGQARGHCSYGQGFPSGSPARFFLFWPHLNLENPWLQRTDLWPCFKGGRNMAYPWPAWGGPAEKPWVPGR